MKKILINFAHPAQNKSAVNRAMRAAVEGIEGITVNDLYSHYPDFMIDIQREQRLCEAHDVIIFQHPFYWYSTPSIVKEWMDLVLEHGWAYGHTGNALAGKIAFQAISTGGDADTYQKHGANQFTISELTSPFQATVHLCKLDYLPPFLVTGAHRGLPSEQLEHCANQYKRTLIALRDGLFNTELAQKNECLNGDLTRLIRSA